MDLTSSKKMLNEEDSKKIVIQGQDFEKCSTSFLIKFMFIIQNLQKNTNIWNFKMSKQIKKGNILIYELLERKNNYLFKS